MDFVFPNEVNVTWTVMIVLYPYITGLVAGAFIVSSLYHVFGIEALKPVARFSLASAFVFLLFAPLPLLSPTSISSGNSPRNASFRLSGASEFLSGATRSRKFVPLIWSGL